MWPFPGNENFHKNFGEDLISLHKYAGDIWTIFKTLKDSNKMSKEFASLSKKELSKEQYSILFSTTEKLLRKYTSKITHTFALSKNKEYILHSPSLSGYIGQIILQDITSSFSPRYCLNLKCGRPIFNPSRIDQQWCNDICGNAQRVANWRKIKKLKALLKNKKISKKEHDKQLYLIENNIIFE